LDITLCKISSENLKEYLHQVADQVKAETSLEDVYNQLALLVDIDESEIEVKQGNVMTHEAVMNESRNWLK